MNNIKYAEFVLRLAKPGDKILPTLDVRKTNLLIATLGLVTEVGELMTNALTFDDGDEGKQDNELEEFGDLEFYYTLLVCSYVPAYDTALRDQYLGSSAIAELDEPRSLTSFASLVCDRLASMIKAFIWYERPLVKEDMEDVLFAIRVWLCEAYEAKGVSVEQIRQHNYAKLIKRYPNGYSDTAANARADKNES